MFQRTKCSFFPAGPVGVMAIDAADIDPVRRAYHAFGFRYFAFEVGDGGVGRVPVSELHLLLRMLPEAWFCIDVTEAAVIPDLVWVIDEKFAQARVCVGSPNGAILADYRRLCRTKDITACTALAPRALERAIRFATRGRRRQWGLGAVGRGRIRTDGAHCIRAAEWLLQLTDMEQRRLIAAAHRAHLGVHVAAFDEREILRCLELGVDVVESADPAALARVFDQLELPVDGGLGDERRDDG